MVRLSFSIPPEAQFFQMFIDVAENVTEGARLMKALLEDYRDVDARVTALKAIEHRGDDMTHAILTLLNQTYITPFDHEDIYRLAEALDDVLDQVNSAGDRLVTYKVASVTPAAATLAGLILQQSQELGRAVAMLEKNHNVFEHCLEINRLENEADRVAREAIGSLFESETNPINLIKIKELYEVLELATDKAEDAANVLETVALKRA
jgi:predicted phosphate transport protein (TIGR00153 family)